MYIHTPLDFGELTHKQLEMHGCVISTVATAALVLKHQAISNHSADKIFMVSAQFHTKILHLLQKTLKDETTILKNYIQLFKG